MFDISHLACDLYIQISCQFWPEDPGMVLAISDANVMHQLRSSDIKSIHKRGSSA